MLTKSFYYRKTEREDILITKYYNIVTDKLKEGIIFSGSIKNLLILLKPIPVLEFEAWRRKKDRMAIFSPSRRNVV